MKRTPRHSLVFGLVVLLAAAAAVLGGTAVGHASRALSPAPDGPAPSHEEGDCPACQSANSAAALAELPALSWLVHAEASSATALRERVQTCSACRPEAARAPPARLVT